MKRLMRVLRPRRPITTNQYGDAVNAFDTSLWEPTNIRTYAGGRGKS